MVNDFIYIDSWRRLSEEAGHRDLYYGSTEEAPDLLAQIEKTGRPSILLTGCSDLGLTLQADAHPNEDLMKMIHSVPWNTLMDDRTNYRTVQIGPCCYPDVCKTTDTYSLKMDRFTFSTFEDIPDNLVHWYTTNLNLKHPRITLLPFGLNTDGPGSSYLPKYIGRKKEKLFYVNFQPHSVERMILKERYQDEPWATVVKKADLPVEQYLEDIASHKFVLAAPGNGLDSYRIWESIYLGAVPILSDSIFARHLMDYNLPVVVTNDPSSLTEQALLDAYQGIQKRTFSLNAARLTFWKDKILQEVACLIKP